MVLELRGDVEGARVAWQRAAAVSDQGVAIRAQQALDRLRG
jgi:hypothetical protein